MGTQKLSEEIPDHLGMRLSELVDNLVVIKILTNHRRESRSHAILVGFVTPRDKVILLFTAPLDDNNEGRLR